MGAAVRPKHAELGFKILFAPQGLLDLFIAALPVFRVDALLPRLIRAAELQGRDTVEPVHLVIPRQPVVGHIVFPDAQAGRARRQRQPVAARLQRGFRLLARGDVAQGPDHPQRLPLRILLHHLAVERAPEPVTRLHLKPVIQDKTRAFRNTQL